MNTTLKQQINAIHSVMNLDDVTKGYPELRPALNDAASTLAAINLNPDIFNRVKELEESNSELLEALVAIKLRLSFSRTKEADEYSKDDTTWITLANKAIDKAKSIINS